MYLFYSYEARKAIVRITNVSWSVSIKYFHRSVRLSCCHMTDVLMYKIMSMAYFVQYFAESLTYHYVCDFGMSIFLCY